MGRAGIGAALLAICVLFGVSSCLDDIAPPTRGSLIIELTGSTAGAYEGASLWIDSLLVVPSIAQASYTYELPAGDHRIRIRQACADILPDTLLTVVVRAGHTERAAFDVRPRGAIEVLSTMPGAEIFLDGERTGRVTPATFSCIEPGEYSVAVELFGAESAADSVRQVIVANEPVQVTFELTPTPQGRRAFFEVLTATFCPPCYIADEAVDEFWHDADLVARGFVGAQVHLSWSGSDSLATPWTIARATGYYGVVDGAPYALTNGLYPRQGEGHVPAYRGLIESFLDGSEGGSPVALYWREAERTPGTTIRGTMRVVVLEDIVEPDTVLVMTASYKNNLTTRGRRGNVFTMLTYNHVIREIRRHGSMTQLGLRHRGDWRDIEVVFELDWDRRSSGSLWPEEGMGLIGFVQHMPSRTVHQVAHTVP